MPAAEGHVIPVDAHVRFHCVEQTFQDAPATILNQKFSLRSHRNYAIILVNCDRWWAWFEVGRGLRSIVGVA